MLKPFVSVFLPLLLVFSMSAAARVNEIKSLRLWATPEKTRVVFDVSSPPKHRLLVLDNPKRLVIDFPQTRLIGDLSQPPAKHALISGIRSGVRNKNDLRVVLDLRAGITPKTLSLKPNKVYGKGHRLVVDLFHNQKTQFKRRQVRKSVKSKSWEARDIIIAIDAGHGGVDPGARGPAGTYEKDVVLPIARKLAALVRQESGMRPVMIRDGDVFLDLRERIGRARNAKADLFISIHADAFKNSKVRGSSVFTLSENGASSEAARWLATRENAADLVGGVKLGDKGDVLKSVLLDLSQTATREASHRVAGQVLDRVKEVGSVHYDYVQKAGFVVLKSPDIPSLLIETAFISNPQEEKKLLSSTHQMRFAQAIFKGVHTYFASNAPPGTRLAHRKHTIVNGETLSGIAARYGVSMSIIKVRNALKNNLIRIGQILEIPRDS